MRVAKGEVRVRGVAREDNGSDSRLCCPPKANQQRREMLLSDKGDVCLTLFLAETTMALVEDDAVFASRQFDIENSGLVRRRWNIIGDDKLHQCAIASPLE